MSKAGKVLKLNFLFGIIFFSHLCLAQSKAPSLVGGLVGGIVQFNPISPTVNDIKLNNGFSISIEGQKSAGFLNAYLLGSLDYVKTTGSLDYNYLSPTNITYAANMIGFNFDSFRATLALRFKILQNSFFRPYIEGGGSLGYTQLSYDPYLRSAVGALGSDYKMSDSALDFAGFGEFGVEADFSLSMGLEIGVRYTHNSTRPIETFRRQILSYDSLTYLAGIFLRL